MLIFFVLQLFHATEEFPDLALSAYAPPMGEVLWVSDETTLQQASDMILRDGVTMVGFDTESVPSLMLEEKGNGAGW